MNRTKPSVENVECCEPKCLGTPMADIPVPLCGHHAGRVYEFAQDLLIGSGNAHEIQPDHDMAIVRMMRTVGLAVRTPGEALIDRVVAVLHDSGKSATLHRIRQATEWGIKLTEADKRSIAKVAADEYAQHEAENRESYRAALAHERAKADPDEMVYYMRFGDRVKIGYTTNLGKRRLAVPNDEVLAIEPGTRTLEAMRHRQFAELRITGEWFHYAEPLTEHIEGLRRAVA